MPKPLFLQLPIAKQNQIFQALLQEFGTYPYEEASTNRIVKQAKISKGSLFNYFADKATLYLYTLKRAHLSLVETLKSDAAPPILQESDLFTCFQSWAKAQLKLLHTEPAIYDLFRYFRQAPAFLKQRYGNENKAVFTQVQQEFFGHVDTSLLRQSLPESLRILMWGYQGIQTELELFTPPLWQLSLDERKAFEETLLAHLDMFCQSTAQGLLSS